MGLREANATLMVALGLIYITLGVVAYATDYSDVTTAHATCTPRSQQFEDPHFSQTIKLEIRINCLRIDTLYRLF